jgi:hypothetical protein
MKTTIDMAREIAAEYMKPERFQTWTHGYMMERLMELVAVSAESEREACWRLCDALWIEGKDAHDCREAIRNRGTHEH